MEASSSKSHASSQNRPCLLGKWIFSSIGKKTVVALTGILLILFVITHLLGNLTFFFGPDAMNAYAHKLQGLGPLLWVARIGLLLTVVLHIYFTMLLWKENQAARPVKYQMKNHVQATVFSRTMRLSGMIVMAFVLFHLAHFTLFLVYPEYANLHTNLHGEVVHDVYRMVVFGFSNVYVSAFYILGLGLLASHLSHGISSLFQSLGLSNGKMQPLFEKTGYYLAWILFFGYISIPISVLIFQK